VLNRVILQAKRCLAPARINVPRDFRTRGIDVEQPAIVGVVNKLSFEEIRDLFEIVGSAGGHGQADRLGLRRVNAYRKDGTVQPKNGGGSRETELPAD
jgi:hypothetical protein